MAREQAEHFWPLNPKAEATTPSTAASRSASAHTRIESLPPISRIVRLIQIWPGCALAARSLNVEADGLRAGEGDEARLGMLDDGVAEGCAGAGAEVDHAVGHAGLFKHLDEFGRDGGRVAGGLEDHGVAA